jgi:hypothetical protein
VSELEPTAEVVGISHDAETRSITVLCPHCGETHTHGWSRELGKMTTTHRQADCMRGGYFITINED